MTRAGPAGRRRGATAGLLVAAVASFTGCDLLEFQELTQPPMDARPVAAVSFQTQHDDALLAHLSVSLRDWADADEPPRVLLGGDELTAAPFDDPARTIYQRNWVVDPEVADQFPLELLLSPPSSMEDDPTPIPVPLTALLRSGPRTICLADHDLTLDYRMLGELPGNGRWSLDLYATGGTRFHWADHGLPARPLTVPREMVPTGDSATVILTIVAGHQRPTAPEVGLSVQHTVHWRVVRSGDEDGCTP